MKKALLNLTLLLAIVGLFSCSQNTPKKETTSKASEETNLVANTSKTQKNKDIIPASKSDVIFNIVDKHPSYVGGTDKMVEYLSKNITPRTDLFKKKTKFAISFVVEVDSSLSNIEVFRIEDPHVIKEVTKIIGNMKWVPAVNKGKRVRCKYMLPIFFPYEMPDDPVDMSAK
ncbi:MAG: energy transducer TonB [Hyphomicrobiales bacterium]